MYEKLDKLIRMLTQEKKLGYKNKAIFGGFEKLAPNWANEALEVAKDESDRQFIKEIENDLSQYPEIPEADRPHYLHTVMVKLHKTSEALLATTGNGQEEEAQVERPAPAENAVTSAESDVPEPPSPLPPAPIPEKRAASDPPEAQAKPAGRESRSAGQNSKSQTRTKKKRDAAGTASRQRNAEWDGSGLDSSVTRLPGIKDAMAKKLEKLGVVTVGDFLSLYPRRYDDYRSLKTINQLELGEDVTIIAQVWETRQQETRNRKMTMIKSVLTDGTATIEVTWFNQPWLVNKLKPGTQIVLSGTVEQYLGRLTFNSPEWEELDKEMIHTGRLVPVYPLTKGVNARWLRNRIKSAVDYWADRLPDYMTDHMQQRLQMPPLAEALQQIHFPDGWDSLETARRRMAFDELLMIQVGVLRQRQKWQEQEGHPVINPPGTVDRILQVLPFQLTTAQQKALTGIIGDIEKNVPMSRLLQGDVGSGKTVIALVAMVLTVHAGGQAAILAPTEILAEQHFKGMEKQLETISQTLDRPINIRLLTGSTTATARKELLEQLASGQIDILVGTHAIIQEDVALHNLRLAVIDEQHRFGVEQRAALRDKGYNPHMLVMTATPIPRTLALTLYGDLDLSVIDEMPPGRQPIKTRWLTPRERERAYSFIQSQISKGHQAYIICPLVEESDKTEARSAIEEHKRLATEIFPQFKLGLLHGRMKSDEKEKVMKAFRDVETQILVSTSVVEVGIDIPNSTVMLVEGANRFGLSQLHQFRGRVGRGEQQSYCLLLADNVTPEAEERLRAVEQTSNGFDLAEHDLKMRGPGEFFGTRQSGLPDLKLVKLSDTRLLELARSEAQKIFEEDERLEKPENRLLAKQVADFWRQTTDLS
jgi:ATP-dependent DNA helicase RecG